MNKKEEEKKLLADKASSESASGTASLSGVDKTVQDKAYNNTFTASGTQTQAQSKANSQLSNYESIASKDNIVSNDTWGKINSTFKTPTAVTQADAYLKNALSKIQSGKTSYTDQISNLMSQITNREKFSYDVDNDTLFQQALASAMNSGRTAMQDTIGQASALTGGYGSTYATSAANQAYNAYIEDAYNNLPQYYQMALEAYNAEGDEMYRQLDMYNTADATEYSRMLNAYDATSSYRNQAYNEAYQQYRDSKSDAYASANLQLSEHSQLTSDAYNLYNAYANEADKMYEKEYTKWSDEVSQAMQYAQALNTEYWKDKSFTEEQRQYNESLKEQQRQFDEKLENSDYWNQKQLDFDKEKFDRTSAQSVYEFAVTHGDKDGNGVLTPDEIEAYNAQASSRGLGSVRNYKFSDSQISKIRDIHNTQGEDAMWEYVAQIGMTPQTPEEADLFETIYSGNSSSEAIAPLKKTGTVSKFRTAKNDNFEITVGDKTYKVENHGKVDDKTKEQLDKLKVDDEAAFTYNGEVYVKYAGGYYKVGARALSGNAYHNVLATLK